MCELEVLDNNLTPLVINLAMIEVHITKLFLVKSRYTSIYERVWINFLL